LHVVARGPNRIRRFRSLLPSFAGASFSVASEDGGALYQFDAAGRHLQTVDSLTGATIYAFSYDGANRLVGIQDGDGNTTTITRNASGAPTALTGPFGQVTTLTLDANGFLASLKNPADETVAMTYTDGGLLTAFTDARDQTSSYEYDELGRLTHTEDPAGGSNTLTRTELPNGHELTKTTALGRTTTFRVERLPTGGQRLTNTGPDGTVAEINLKPDGTQTTLLADGTIATAVLGPDPRFGMQAPVVASATVETPGGLTFASSQARTAVLNDPDDPLSLSTLTETSSVNGRTTTRQYDRSANTRTETTPEGRQRIETLDALRRVVRKDAPGLAPITYAYDGRGLLTAVVEGTGPTARTMQITYDAHGYVARIDQPEGLRTDATRDDAGRLSTIVLPGNRTISYGYDTAGNVTSITPPGRPPQIFAHDAQSRLSGYTAPDAGNGAETTTAAYNADRQLTERALPGGATIAVAYGATTGRLASQTLARGAITYAYDPATGHLASITAPDAVVLAYETDGPLPEPHRVVGARAGTVERVHDAASTPHPSP
jgi:YD repeat-containing protein